jgi:hypothetical protein
VGTGIELLSGAHARSPKSITATDGIMAMTNRPWRYQIGLIGGNIRLPLPRLPPPLPLSLSFTQQHGTELGAEQYPAVWRFPHLAWHKAGHPPPSCKASNGSELVAF